MREFLPQFASRNDLEAEQLRRLQWSLAHAYNNAAPYASNNNNSAISSYLTNAPDFNLSGTAVANVPAGIYYIHNINWASGLSRACA